MAASNLLLFPLFISSLFFYVYNFFTSCHKYSFAYLVYVHREHCSKLDAVLHYALQPDIFDPLTDYNLPQSRLRGLCVATSQKQLNSTKQIQDHIYSMRIFHEQYWSAPFVTPRTPSGPRTLSPRSGFVQQCFRPTLEYNILSLCVGASNTRCSCVRC